MDKVTFRQDEVLAFLEDKIIQGEANDDEVEFYQDYRWNEVSALNTYKQVYKRILKKMQKEYNNN